jgi:phosphatidate cytidylyltransferase
VSNLLQRLLLFFLGIPAIVAVIAFLPQARHAATVVFLLGLLGGASLELARLFDEKGIKVRTAAIVALGTAPSLFAYLGCVFADSADGLGPAGVLAIGAGFLAAFALTPFALAKAEEIPSALPAAAASGFALFYPGVLGAFLTLIASEPRWAMESLLSFTFITFGNDSLAWLIGMTLARKRGVVAVSPNKSVAGFVGGMIGSLICAFGSQAIFPYAMRAAGWEILALGLAVGAAAIFGDLFESALKRSAGAKDSGQAVPGRGGILDSIDSLLLSAPVFYGLSLLLGLFK